MFLHIGTPRGLADLPSVHNPTAAARTQLKILVIDDQPFILKDVLATHGFALREVRDVDSVEAASAYPIVVCDIKGVGQAFGSKHEGAHLFKELRRFYPDKYIIAFSGYRFDATYNEYFRAADVSLKKDADTEAWVRVLDEAIAVMSEPEKRWLRLRRYLLEERAVDLWSVFTLEQAFIKAVRSRDGSLIVCKGQSLNLSSDLTKVITSFAQSLSSDVLVNMIASAVTGA